MDSDFANQYNKLQVLAEELNEAVNPNNEAAKTGEFQDVLQTYLANPDFVEYLQTQEPSEFLTFLNTEAILYALTVLGDSYQDSAANQKNTALTAFYDVLRACKRSDTFVQFMKRNTEASEFVEFLKERVVEPDSAKPKAPNVAVSNVMPNLPPAPNVNAKQLFQDKVETFASQFREVN